MVPVVPGAVQYKYYKVPDGFKRLRTKRKVALIFGYIGERYCGLQWNHLPDYPTVEEALLKALYEADMISLTNFSNRKVQQLLNFERASRTDKGVHALCNVVSVNVMLPYDPVYVREEQARMEAGAVAGGAEPPPTTSSSSSSPSTTDSVGGEEGSSATPKFSLDEAKRILRLALPADIHLYDIVPVTRSFNAYLCCGGRRYEYFLPTFALLTAAEYSETYFPAALAPSHPTLKDVGFRPGKRLPERGRHREEAIEDTGDADREAGEKGPRGRDGQSAGGASGRKSKGHFPKSKKRREEDALKRQEEEAQKAARREAAAAAVKEKEKETETERASLAEETTAAESTERVESARVRVIDDKTEEEMRDGEGGEAEEGGEEEGDDDHNINIDDPVALEAFLSSHYATHFQDHLFESMILFRTIPQEHMARVGRHRITPTQLEHVRELFHLYEGTHCYHNFTPGGRSTDASCHRYMRRITVSEPMIWKPGDPLLEESIRRWTPSRFFAPDERLTEACDAARDAAHATAQQQQQQHLTPTAKEDLLGSGLRTSSQSDIGMETPQQQQQQQEEEDEVVRQQWRKHLQEVYPDGIEIVRIELDGQSFMLNQIRKMIGAVVAISAAGLPSRFLTEELLRKGRHLPIPMVPANGLLLSFLDFSGYGSRLDRIQKNGNNGTGKVGIDVEALMPKDELEQQERRTVSVMVRNEMGNDLMGKWMRSLRHALRLAWKHEIP